jgi:hypothetical protein
MIKLDSSQRHKDSSIYVNPQINILKDRNHKHYLIRYRKGLTKIQHPKKKKKKIPTSLHDEKSGHKSPPAEIQTLSRDLNNIKAEQQAHS